MSEAEQPTPQEVKAENPVVGAARAAVRTALETSDAVKDFRDGMEVKKNDIIDRPNVYKAWTGAMENVVNNMTKTDQQKFSTKMYEAKMKLVGAGVHVGSWAVDTTVRVASWPLRTAFKVIGVGLAPFTGGSTLEMYLAGKGMDLAVKRGVVATYEQGRAKAHEAWQIRKYQVAEAATWIKDSGKNAAQLSKNILTGFAYPDGKPVKEKPGFFKRVFGKK